MHILLIGAKGNMGKRYKAILNWLKVPIVTEVDFGDSILDSSWTSFDKAIIATPTETHPEWCIECITHGVPFLCEKPIAKSLGEVKIVAETCSRFNVQGNMVCNWKFTLNKLKMHPPGKNSIEYDCYNTGKDGLSWDCIQLIYLANPKKLKLECKNPVMRVFINNWSLTLDDVARSYIRMVEMWLTKPENLWNMEDAVKATIAVEEYKK